MRMTLVLHIIAGTLGIVSGFVALYVTKGASLHRRAGIVFVYAMLTTGVGGLLIAIVRNVAPSINIPAAVLTGSLVITALTTMRPASTATRWLDRSAMLATLAVGLASMMFGFEALANGGMRNEMPAFPFFMFGIVGLLASVGDVRMMRSGPLRGASRLARHLWRMSFALFIAALSFFVGQADVFPKPVRILPLLALPVLTVLVTMFYWLWRVRIKRNLRGIVGVGSNEPLIAKL